VNRLIGTALPSLALWSTEKQWINLATVKGRSVIFCYPYTGKPGVPDPLNWDHTPGAHGSTPQAQAYSMAYGEFQKQNVSVFGLSLQTPEWQSEAATRLELHVPLLSDADQKFTRALNLPFFTIEGEDYLERLTLIIQEGTILAVRHPVPSPANDAMETLSLFQSLTP
jgi:peroxiredoxin